MFRKTIILLCEKVLNQSNQMNFTVIILSKETPIYVVDRIANSMDEITETILNECIEESINWRDISIHDIENKITKIISKKIDYTKLAI